MQMCSFMKTRIQHIESYKYINLYLLQIEDPAKLFAKEEPA
jgi:hypothetical protein